MKKRRVFRWGISLFIPVIISSLLVIPTFAQSNQKQDDNIKSGKQLAEYLKIQEQNNRLHKIDKKSQDLVKKVQNQKLNSSIKKQFQTITAPKVLISNGIDRNVQHQYVVKIESGTDLSIAKSGSQEVTWILYDSEHKFVANEDQYPNNSISGLSPGIYYLNLRCFDDEGILNLYDITLTGDSLTVDPNIPRLDVNIPTDHHPVLGYELNDLLVSGSHWGALGTLYTDKETYNLENKFSKKIPMHPGRNYMDVVIVNSNGNSLTASYYPIRKDTARLGGSDRYDTSVEISKYEFEKADTIVVARGDHFADALSGGPLASLYNSPLLLVKPDAIPTVTKQEIQRLQPKKAVILGGAGAVSEAVANELRDMGVTIDRIDGADRFIVSAKIAQRMIDYTKDFEYPIDSVFVVTGHNFPDALSASAPAGSYKKPILLVSSKYLPSSIEQLIKNHKQLRNFMIVGGDDVVGIEVAKKLNMLAKERSGLFTRIEGANRFIVSANVAHLFYQDEVWGTIVANGMNFPDALSGAPLATYYGPILLTQQDKLEFPVKNYLQPINIYNLLVLGDEGAISDNVYNQLKEYVR